MNLSTRTPPTSTSEVPFELWVTTDLELEVFRCRCSPEAVEARAEGLAASYGAPVTIVGPNLSRVVQPRYAARAA